MYNPDIHSVRSGNVHTLTIATPVAMSKEPGDYNGLSNKPSINGVELVGDMTWEDFGLPDLSDLSEVPTKPLSSSELEQITEN